MYSRASQILRTEVKVLHKNYFAKSSKLLVPVCNITIFPKTYTTERNFNGSHNFHKRFSVQYICYSILFGAATYASYKIW